MNAGRAGSAGSAVTRTAELPATVALVPTLHDLDGCRTGADVERPVEAGPDRRIRRVSDDLRVVGLRAGLPRPPGAGLGPVAGLVPCSPEGFGAGGRGGVPGGGPGPVGDVQVPAPGRRAHRPAGSRRGDA
ncbi:hypothetical protein ACFVVL_00930 [Kitasatospora sp. NPDC058115]|uniref:hypothetical protein n=1 Tax=Kitasatospora sp. NPDC058115 TaxID=3346347 RepID=UPI0036DCA507